jgi:hypothetical protein
MELIFLFFLLMLVFGILFIGTLTWLLIYYFHIRKVHYMPKNTDIQVYITKEGRFEIDFQQLEGKTKIEYKGNPYFTVPKCSIPNNRGKTFTLYFRDKPAPLYLEFEKAEVQYLNSKSVNSMINNEYIPRILNPQTWRDIVLLITFILSILTFFTVIIIALKLFGVLGEEKKVTVVQNNPQVL